ncbi:MAG: enoyl-CoA hydratase/isomerase family protein [Chloroflexi bacterium]|nr:enoyl-CoA hydratase/isomerase family protein [Chloroflexota bacterium]
MQTIKELKEVVYTKEGGIAIITLNRPERLNAFTHDMIDSWASCIEEAKLDNDVKVVVVTGAGRGFCSGMDARAAAARHESTNLEVDVPLPQRRNNLRYSVHRVPRALATLDKPYIGAINGPAAGAGMDMASMCDIRFASDTARFTMAYVKMGLVPGDGGCYFLPRIVGLGRALDLIWTGRIFDAQEAMAMGYVQEVVPADKLMERVKEYAQQIISLPATSIQVAKRLVYQCMDADLSNALDLCQYGQFIAQTTEDSKEGPRAFAERRPPQFKGY